MLRIAAAFYKMDAFAVMRNAGVFYIIQCTASIYLISTVSFACYKAHETTPDGLMIFLTGILCEMSVFYKFFGYEDFSGNT